MTQKNKIITRIFNIPSIWDYVDCGSRPFWKKIFL